MNRFLLKALLVCMIITCMTSGTMAVYTTTVDEAAQTTINAKRFYIGVNSAPEFEIKLAPGEKGETVFTVTNTDGNGNPTEVDMDLTIGGSYKELITTIPGLNVYMTDDQGNTLCAVDDQEGTLYYHEDQAFTADINASRTFHIVFDWRDVTLMDQAAASGKSVRNTTLYITGSQHIPS